MHLAKDCGRYFVLCALTVVLGCTPIRPKAAKTSPLSAAHMAPDSVTLDVFFVRCPFGDAVVNEELWQEIDEQQIPLETRRRLSENGFRVGMACGRMPTRLSELLELKGRPASAGAAQSTVLTEVGCEEGPMWSHQQLRAGKRSEIVTSDIYPELPVLLSGPDGVCGETYRKAQGVLALRAIPQQDGRVLLELVPELHHDEAQRSFSGSQGAWRMDMERPRCVFDDMAISTHLSAGHMILLSCLPSRPGSLGNQFLTTESSGSLEQKLVVIRLSQTQHDSLFEPSAISLDQLP